MFNIIFRHIMAQYRIKDLLKERNMTQKDLAQRIGVSAVTLNRYLTGNPSVSSLEKIAGALDVDISELFVHRENLKSDSIITCPNCGNKFHIAIKIEDYGKEGF